MVWKDMGNLWVAQEDPLCLGVWEVEQNFYGEASLQGKGIPSGISLVKLQPEVALKAKSLEEAQRELEQLVKDALYSLLRKVEAV